MQNYGPHLRPILSACLWVRPRVTISSTNIYLLKFKYFNIAQFWLLFSCIKFKPMFSSVQFSRSVVSDSLQPYELQHTRLPCPSPTLGVYSDSCPLSRWCHPAIPSSVAPFSSPQSFPASGFFSPMSWLFASGGQGIEVLASTSVLPMNIQGWFPLGLIGLIS